MRLLRQTRKKINLAIFTIFVVSVFGFITCSVIVSIGKTEEFRLTDYRGIWSSDEPEDAEGNFTYSVRKNSFFQYHEIVVEVHNDIIDDFLYPEEYIRINVTVEDDEAQPLLGVIIGLKQIYKCEARGFFIDITQKYFSPQASKLTLSHTSMMHR